MLANWIRKKGQKMSPDIVRRLFNLYVPFRGAGVTIKHIADDYRFIRVEMPLTWYNQNYVGTQFGGSIYAMTDPFYMLMLMQNLGPDYIVWDKAASIDFIKPGRGRLIVEFSWSEEEIALIRDRTRGGEKYLTDKEVEIRDKPVDINLEGRSLKEIWPAAVRPQ